MDYWLGKNKSLDYPFKLEQLFNKSLELLSGYPESGQIFSIAPPIFFKIVRGYRIYYVFDSYSLTVISIWDTRRNPDKFRL